MTKIYKGMSILIDLPSPFSKHLFFILADSIGTPVCALMVNISTQRGLQFEDTTTTLSPGDHPFITQPSFIPYDCARKLSVDILQERLTSGRAVQKEDMSDDLYDSVANGLLTSSRTPIEIKKLFRIYSSTR